MVCNWQGGTSCIKLDKPAKFLTVNECSENSYTGGRDDFFIFQ